MDTDKSLEQIIKERKSTRKFSKEMLPEDLIKKIIEAGVYAPYGGATGIPLREIRKFFVLKQGTEPFDRVRNIILGQIKGNAKKINRLLMFLPFLKKKMGAFANRLNALSKNGIAALDDAPYLIIIAEKKGFPPVEKESMAHAFENMWLTATDLGLGFQLISAFSTVEENEKLLELLRLKEDKYAIGGCAVGYPENPSVRNKSHETEHFITWL